MEADPKQTGEALRELRRSRGLSLRDLARKSGCSPSFISQVEQGKTSPSLVTAKRICRALDMMVADFLALNNERRKARHVPKCNPSQLVTKWPKASLHHLLPATEQTNFSILVLELPPRGQTAWRAAKRTMQELAVVLKGTVVFEIGNELKRMSRNDGVYFDLLNRHRWRNVGRGQARVLLLNPNFTEVPDTD
jgi:transcriptional regulator with XRE-family HTH domain